MESERFIQLITEETGIPVQSHRIILDGWDNHVLEVNNDTIFRFTRRTETQVQHIKELELLPYLNNKLSLKVPKPIHWRTQGKPPFYMAYKRIDGEPLTREEASQIDTDYLVESFANLLSELQDTPISLFKQVPVYTNEVWRTQYFELYNQILDKIAPRLDETIVESIKTIFDEPLNKSNYFDFIPALIHRDLTSDHILNKDREITGVIDWGDACFGDPAFDLAGFIMDYDPNLVTQLIETLDVPEHCLKRARFYAKISPFYECLYGLETGDEKIINTGLMKIRKKINRISL